MNKLQQCIGEKLAAGKSFRDMEHESGVSHVSISKYHKGATPDGKNLAKLGKYFHVDYFTLLDPVDSHSKSTGPQFGQGIDDQLAETIWSRFSPEQKRRAVELLREQITDDQK